MFDRYVYTSKDVVRFVNCHCFGALPTAGPRGAACDQREAPRLCMLDGEREEAAMPPLRPFRFAAPAIRAASGAALAAQARRVEDLGYATLVIPDHFLPTNMAAGPALMAAAAATTTLRVGTTVYDNDFRHPALLAKEAATLHVLTDGRFEFGIGAGYYKAEYDQTGIPFSPAGVRVGRLEEAVALIKALWGPDPVTFAGRYYRVSNLRVMAPPHPPYPPLYIGAGGKRLLSFAAREANIIGIIAPSQSGGGLALA